MTLEITTETKTTIKTKILEMVESAWAAGQHATLVAQVGFNLSKEFNLRRELGGLKLADFIKNELNNDLKFIDSPKDPKIKALVPANATLDSEIANHFKKVSSQIESTGYNRISIHRGIWKAFSSELPAGFYRHIKLEPHVHFEDASSNTLAGYIPISQNLIFNGTNANKQVRDATIQENIFSWADANAISRDLLLENRSAISHTSKKQSLFDALVGALDSNDFNRISIPLDIVLKLQNKHL